MCIFNHWKQTNLCCWPIRKDWSVLFTNRNRLACIVDQWEETDLHCWPMGRLWSRSHLELSEPLHKCFSMIDKRHLSTWTPEQLPDEHCISYAQQNTINIQYLLLLLLYNYCNHYYCCYCYHCCRCHCYCLLHRDYVCDQPINVLLLGINMLLLWIWLNCNLYLN